MKNLFKIFIIVLIPLCLVFSQEEKKVLVEVFTNSHCPLCPPAHNAINNYLAGPNGDKINFIFYHMAYPYSDDSLYLHNATDSDGRDDYYHQVHATPRGFFDGQVQGSVSVWTSSLDNLVTTDSPLIINLSGIKGESSFSIKANVTRTGNIPDDDLVIQFVVVEDLDYTGRNTISHHENVMRKMVDGAFGYPFSIGMNETKVEDRQVPINNEWVKDSLKVVVFVQSDSNKTIYQSATLNYSEFSDPSDVGAERNLPKDIKLEQNYPNPFNPSTKISYQLPDISFVTLKVYNILGKQVSTLVNKRQQAGNYESTFSAGNLSSGIYFYRLTVVNSAREETVQTKKMTLIK